MKKILKVILIPIYLFLSAIQLVSTLIVNIATSVLSVISLVTLITGIFCYFNDGAKTGITILIFSFLVSPFGIPAIAQFIIQIVSAIKNKLIKN